MTGWTASRWSERDWNNHPVYGVRLRIGLSNETAKISSDTLRELADWAGRAAREEVSERVPSEIKQSVI